MERKRRRKGDGRRLKEWDEGRMGGTKAGKNGMKEGRKEGKKVERTKD